MINLACFISSLSLQSWHFSPSGNLRAGENTKPYILPVGATVKRFRSSYCRRAFSRASQDKALCQHRESLQLPNLVSHSFPNSRLAIQAYTGHPFFLRSSPEEAMAALQQVTSHFLGHVFPLFSFLLWLLSFLCQKMYCSNYSFWQVCSHGRDATVQLSPDTWILSNRLAGIMGPWAHSLSEDSSPGHGRGEGQRQG